ncbi:hypothetical protein [Enterobacter ludwigii]|jgi:hypothetical protein|uniref:hypothetical protein n=1 Tax=Enterobacter ludwigii TaxID=299767 RepID=UPI0007B36A98|nr:hypothetical protein [Enterobacter ludwigii]ELI8912791.1 hypothetical protein [Enterobacter kobei]ELI8917587.1 hypothetical protein [Enterobacter kobei]KZP49655.1 hypothetical protein A3N37_16965 [Enterobacter ludwigii]
MYCPNLLQLLYLSVSAIVFFLGLFLLNLSRKGTGKTDMMLYKYTFRPNLSLHMRWGKSPTGHNAYKELEQHSRDVLLDLRNAGYKTVRFTSHLIRKGSESKLREFLSTEKMSIVQLNYIPTPLPHYAIIQLEMLITRKRKIKVNKVSGKIIIKLND